VSQVLSTHTFHFKTIDGGGSYFYQDYFLIAFDIYPSFLFEYFQLQYLSVKSIFRNIDVYLCGQGRLTIYNPSAICKRYGKNSSEGMG